MIYIVMGVSGCGKSTVGQKLAERLQIPFYDADDFHHAANIEKMKKGIPLDDNDRRPWLDHMARLFTTWDRQGGAVLACSALKQRYRDTLEAGAPGSVRFIWLDGSIEVIAGRQQARKGHFMPTTLLASQFQTLEAPANAVRIILDTMSVQGPEAVVQEVLVALGFPEKRP